MKKKTFEEKLVKTPQGYKIEGWQTYYIQNMEHCITYMRYISEKEVKEFLRRK